MSFVVLFDLPQASGYQTLLTSTTSPPTPIGQHSKTPPSSQLHRWNPKASFTHPISTRSSTPRTSSFATASTSSFSPSPLTVSPHPSKTKTSTATAPSLTFTAPSPNPLSSPPPTSLRLPTDPSPSPSPSDPAHPCLDPTLIRSKEKLTQFYWWRRQFSRCLFALVSRRRSREERGDPGFRLRSRSAYTPG